MSDQPVFPQTLPQWILVVFVSIALPIGLSLMTTYYVNKSASDQLVLERLRLTEEMSVERQRLAEQAKQEDAKLRIEYVKIALGILQPQKDESEEQRVVLDTLAPWAVDVFARSSPVELSPEQRAALKKRAAHFDYDDGYTYDYRYRDYRTPNEPHIPDQKK